MSVDLRAFERVVFFTGAGMSAESGVPTYRGKGGTWEQYDFEEYACQDAFDRDPEKVWDFHDMRREKTSACAPHEGHARIAAFEAERPSTVVVTQNIDGMHQRAGSRRVFELHGSLWRVRCDACGELLDDQSVPIASRQHGCGAFLRPDIVWFGDMLRLDVVRAAQAAIAGCDALVSIGTSAVVFPAAELPLHAREGGAVLVEVNPEPTPLSDIYHHHLRAPASEALAQLLPDA